MTKAACGPLFSFALRAKLRRGEVFGEFGLGGGGAA
jgi:hypothetical protein